jgi:hypothetical protein
MNLEFSWCFKSKLLDSLEPLGALKELPIVKISGQTSMTNETGLFYMFVDGKLYIYI